MMNRRLSKLRNEIAPQCKEDISYINSETIKNTVNNKLNSVPSERRIYMKQKLIKSIAVVFIAVAAMATSVLAMYDIDLPSLFFDGDTSEIQSYVENPEKEVSDGNFEVSMDEVISTEYSMKAVFSIKALNNKAKAKLNSDNFCFIRDLYVSFEDESDERYINSWVGKELKEYSTADTKVWEMSVEALNAKSGGETIKLEFSFLDTEDNVIFTELKTDIETAEYVLKGQEYGEATVKINPMSVMLTVGFEVGTDRDLYDTNTYFRMKDGSVKTFNQIFEPLSSTLVKEGKDYDMFEIYADAYNIVDLESFKSIIVDGIEYDFENVNNFKKIDDSGFLRPFDSNISFIGEDSYFPFDDVFDGMKTEVKDNRFEFNGNKYELTDDGDIIKNNDYENIINNAVIEKDGRKYIKALDFCKIFYAQTCSKEGEFNSEKTTVTIMP